MTPTDIRTLQFELTSFCNAQCPHCPRFNIIDPDVYESTGTLHPDLTLSHIDIDLVLPNLQIEKLKSLNHVLIEGDKGDPFMHPQVQKVIEFFSNAPSSPQITVVTNGSMRSSKFWAELGKKYSPNLEIIFSIDGLGDTNHLYRVGTDFEKIMDNAQAFIKAGGYAIWKCIIFKHNEHQKEEIQKISKDTGFAECWIRPPDHRRFKELDKWPVKTNNSVHYLELSTIGDNFCDFKFKPRQKRSPMFPSVTSRICPNLSNGQVYITHENYVIPCCMMHYVTEQNYFGRDDFLKLAGELKYHDLSLYTLEEILKNQFFSNGLLNSLTSNNRHHSCVISCGSQIDKNIKNLIKHD